MAQPASTSSFKIRAAASADVPAIGKILRALGWFDEMQGEDTADTEARVRRHLEMCLKGDSHLVLVAEGEGGEIWGYTSVHWVPYLTQPGPEGFVSELFVHEDARGKGIGAALLEEVRKEAEARGCSRLGVFNRRSRASFARRFYPKHGWVERADMANFILSLEKK